MSSHDYEHRFEIFGTQVRILIGPHQVYGGRSHRLAALEVEALMRRMHRCLTRFDPSELSRLNDNPHVECPVSSLLALAVHAGLRGASESGGLVDPTLVHELEEAGYGHSRSGGPTASLRDALREAPPRVPARPRSDRRWAQVEVDVARRIVRRPPGVQLDTGGSAKGLAADLASSLLRDFATYVVDAGGDIRLGGADPLARVVRIEHPLTGGAAAELELAQGAVATSGLATRIWRHRGRYAHHLIDPSTGAPAWTGVVQATALAPTALAAETLAKAALLSGPERGLRLLARDGGVLVRDDGTVWGTGNVPWIEARVAA